MCVSREVYLLFSGHIFIKMMLDLLLLIQIKIDILPFYYRETW